jgi:hypothetical protein
MRYDFEMIAKKKEKRKKKKEKRKKKKRIKNITESKDPKLTKFKMTFL